MNDNQNWVDPIKKLIDTHGKGSYIVNFPEYRPDLFRFMAHSLDMNFFDYRTEVMSPLGWDAHRLAVDEVDERLMQEAIKGELIACNIESLLAAKEADVRANWLASYLSRQWPKTIVLPLCLYCHDVPISSPNVYSFESNDLPEQSLVNRLLM